MRRSVFCSVYQTKTDREESAWKCLYQMKTDSWRECMDCSLVEGFFFFFFFDALNEICLCFSVGSSNLSFSNCIAVMVSVLLYVLVLSWWPLWPRSASCERAEHQYEAVRLVRATVTFCHCHWGLIINTSISSWPTRIWNTLSSSSSFYLYLLFSLSFSFLFLSLPYTFRFCFPFLFIISFPFSFIRFSLYRVPLPNIFFFCLFSLSYHFPIIIMIFLAFRSFWFPFACIFFFISSCFPFPVLSLIYFPLSFPFSHFLIFILFFSSPLLFSFSFYSLISFSLYVLFPFPILFFLPSFSPFLFSYS